LSILDNAAAFSFQRTTAKLGKTEGNFQAYSDGMLLKIFRVNATHNVFHLGIGIGPTPGCTS